MTTNWIVTRIANTISPTIRFPRTTKAPNAGMIAPTAPGVAPEVRIRRVAETSSERRNSVATSSAGANAENSSGSSTVTESSKTSAEPKTLTPSKTSSSHGGSGTMRMPTTASSRAAKA